MHSSNYYWPLMKCDEFGFHYSLCCMGFVKFMAPAPSSKQSKSIAEMDPASSIALHIVLQSQIIFI